MPSFYHEYLRIYAQNQKKQWENYCHDADHDLSAGDGKLYTLLSRYPLPASTAKLHNFICRGLVDKGPEVSALRNRLDSQNAYTGDAPDRPTLAARMKPDVLALMELRNREAQKLGYADYIDLVMKSEGLDRHRVQDQITAFAEANLDRARQLTEKFQLRWSTWFHDLAHLGQVPARGEAMDYINEFLTELGLAEHAEGWTLAVKDQPIAGWVCPVAVPDDIRILVKPVTSLNQLAVLYHELGHALGHSLNQGRGLDKIPTAIADETKAVMMEHIGIRLMLLEQEQALVRELRLLEDVRTGISFLFELDLNADPSAAEAHYLKHYSRLLPVEEPTLWALDSFRSIDPVYVHNYVLASITASRLVADLKTRYGKNPRQWGRWLASWLTQ